MVPYKVTQVTEARIGDSEPWHVMQIVNNKVIRAVSQVRQPYEQMHHRVQQGLGPQAFEVRASYAA